MRSVGHYSVHIQRRCDQGLLTDQFENPLHTHGPANGGGWFSANLLHQIIVSAACANRALSTQACGDEFENGQVVVVQASHQAVVHGVCNAVGVQDAEHRCEMGLGRLTQKFNQLGCRANHLLHRRVLAVQQPQGVEVQAPLGFRIQHIVVRLKVCDQSAAVRIALMGLAQAVDLQFDVRDSQALA